MEVLQGADLSVLVASVPVVGVLLAWLFSEMKRADKQERRAGEERERNDDLERSYRAALREAAGMSSEESGNGAR